MAAGEFGHTNIIEFFLAVRTEQAQNAIRGFSKSIHQNLTNFQSDVNALSGGLAAPKNFQQFKNNLESLRRDMNAMGTTGVVSMNRMNSAFSTGSITLSNMSAEMRKAAGGYHLGSQLEQLGNSWRTQGYRMAYAGRTMMASLSLPLTAFGTKATNTFMDINREYTRLRKVIGEESWGDSVEKWGTNTINILRKVEHAGGKIDQAVSFSPKSTDSIGKSLQNLGTKLSNTFGVSQKQVASIMADWAAMGYEAENLGAIVSQVLKVGILGDFGSNLEGASNLIRSTMAIWTEGIDDVNEKISKTEFLMSQASAVEAKTSIWLQDLAGSLPEVSNSAKLFNLTFAQTISILAGMKQRGIETAEAANGLKFILQRITNPTEKAAEAFQKMTGVNLDNLLNKNTTGMSRMLAIAEEIVKLESSGEVGKRQAQQLVGDIGGLRQADRFISALRTIIQGKKELDAGLSNGQMTSDFSKGMMAAGESIYDTAEAVGKTRDEILKLAEAKVRINIGAPETQFKILQETLRNLMASLGSEIIPLVLKGMKAINALFSAFIDLPSPIKRFIFALAGILIIAGPLIMIFGSLKFFLGVLTGSLGGFIKALKNAQLIKLSGIDGQFVVIDGAIKGTRDQLNALRQDHINYINSIIEQTPSLIAAIESQAQQLQQQGIKTASAIKQAFQGIQSTIANAFQGAGSQAQQTAQTISSTYKNLAAQIGQTLGGGTQSSLGLNGMIAAQIAQARAGNNAGPRGGWSPQSALNGPAGAAYRTYIGQPSLTMPPLAPFNVNNYDLGAAQASIQEMRQKITLQRDFLDALQQEINTRKQVTQTTISSIQNAKQSGLITKEEASDLGKQLAVEIALTREAEGKYQYELSRLSTYETLVTAQQKEVENQQALLKIEELRLKNQTGQLSLFGAASQARQSSVLNAPVTARMTQPIISPGQLSIPNFTQNPISISPDLNARMKWIDILLQNRLEELRTWSRTELTQLVKTKAELSQVIATTLSTGAGSAENEARQLQIVDQKIKDIQSQFATRSGALRADAAASRAEVVTQFQIYDQELRNQIKYKLEILSIDHELANLGAQRASFERDAALMSNFGTDVALNAANPALRMSAGGPRSSVGMAFSGLLAHIEEQELALQARRKEILSRPLSEFDVAAGRIVAAVEQMDAATAAAAGHIAQSSGRIYGPPAPGTPIYSPSMPFGPYGRPLNTPIYSPSMPFGPYGRPVSTVRTRTPFTHPTPVSSPLPFPIHQINPQSLPIMQPGFATKLVNQGQMLASKFVGGFVGGLKKLSSASSSIFRMFNYQSMMAVSMITGAFMGIAHILPISDEAKQKLNALLMVIMSLSSVMTSLSFITQSFNKVQKSAAAIAQARAAFESQLKAAEVAFASAQTAATAATDARTVAEANLTAMQQKHGATSAQAIAAETNLTIAKEAEAIANQNLAATEAEVLGLREINDEMQKGNTLEQAKVIVTKNALVAAEQANAVAAAELAVAQKAADEILDQYGRSSAQAVIATETLRASQQKATAAAAELAAAESAAASAQKSASAAAAGGGLKSMIFGLTGGIAALIVVLVALPVILAAAMGHWDEFVKGFKNGVSNFKRHLTQAMDIMMPAFEYLFDALMQLGQVNFDFLKKISDKYNATLSDGARAGIEFADKIKNLNSKITDANKDVEKSNKALLNSWEQIQEILNRKNPYVNDAKNKIKFMQIERSNLATLINQYKNLNRISLERQAAEQRARDAKKEKEDAESGNDYTRLRDKLRNDYLDAQKSGGMSMDELKRRAREVAEAGIRMRESIDASKAVEANIRHFKAMGVEIGNTTKETKKGDAVNTESVNKWTKLGESYGKAADKIGYIVQLLGAMVAVVAYVIGFVVKAIAAIEQFGQTVAEKLGLMDVLSNVMGAAMAAMSGNWEDFANYLSRAFAELFMLPTLGMIDYIMAQFRTSLGELIFEGDSILSRLGRRVLNFASLGISDIQFGGSMNLEQKAREWIEKTYPVSGDTPAFSIDAILGKLPAPPSGDQTKQEPGGATNNAAASADASEFISELKNSLDKIVSKFKEKVLEAFDAKQKAKLKAFEKQQEQEAEQFDKNQEAILKVYDDKIKGIEKLNKADEERYATEEYLANRRQILEQRQLDRTNYIQSRRSAVFEGKLDVIRQLDLEEIKSKKDSDKQLADLDEKRRRELVSKERQATIDRIQAAKEAREKVLAQQKREFQERQQKAREAFDKMQEDQRKAFQEQIDTITEYTPRTVQELETMLNKLNTAAANSGLPEQFRNTGNLAMTSFKDAINNARQSLVEKAKWAGNQAGAGLGSAMKKGFEDEKVGKAIADQLSWIQAMSRLPGLQLTFNDRGEVTGGTWMIPGSPQFAAIPFTNPQQALDFADDYNRRAEGGFVNKPEISLIGEAGPELVLPLNRPARMNQLISEAQSKGLMNKMRFGGPKVFSNAIGGGSMNNNESSSSVQQIIINVDNFIGEKEWFAEMMKQYNVRVRPADQVARGRVGRNISSYKDNLSRYA